MNKTTPVKYDCVMETTYLDTRNSPNPTTSVARYNPLVGNDYVSGVSNPSWKVQIAHNSDASTPYSRVSWDINPCTFTARTRTLKKGLTANYIVDDSRWYRVLGESIQTNYSSDSSLQALALSRLKNRLRSASGQASLMAPLAESRELHGLIHTAVNFTNDFLLAYRDLRKGRTKRARRLLYNSWLTYNFGINPLVHDIAQASDAVASFLGRQDHTARYSGYASREGVFTYSPSANIQPPIGAQLNAVANCKFKLSYHYIGAFTSKVLSSNDYTLADHLGLNLQAVPSTLWELTAFSWMADYFTNVGDYLADNFIVPSGTLKYLNLVTKYELVGTHTFSTSIIPNNPNNVELLDGSVGVSSFRYSSFSRSVLGALPTTPLRFKSADEIGMHSISKLLNLVAVLRP